MAPSYASVNVQRRIPLTVNGGIIQPGRTYNWFVQSNCAFDRAWRLQCRPNLDRTPVPTKHPCLKLSILPNPVPISELRIQGLQDPFTWQLMDAFGKVVARGAGEGSTELSVLDLPPGSYTLHWVSEAEAASGAEPVLIMR